MPLSSLPDIVRAIQANFNDMTEICTAKVEVVQKFKGGSRYIQWI